MTPGRSCLRVMLVIVAGLAIGCYESEFPLDPAPQLETDPRLLGSWRCVTPDAADEAVTITVDRSSNRTYAITVQDREKTPDRYEGYATAIRGTTLMNVQDLTEKRKAWIFLRIAFPQPKILFVQLAHSRLFKDVPKSPAAVRTTIERERNNPALYEDLCVCVRMNVDKKASGGLRF